MTTTSTTKTELLEFADLLKANGYTVIMPKDFTTYFHFWKDGVLAYVQKEYFSGYGFSYDYKPSREHGSGQRVSEMTELSLKNANEAISKAARRKATNPQLPKFWASIEEFIAAGKWAEYYIY